MLTGSFSFNPISSSSSARNWYPTGCSCYSNSLKSGDDWCDNLMWVTHASTGTRVGARLRSMCLGVDPFAVTEGTMVVKTVPDGVVLL